MTEVELQSDLMSYADRFASILIQAFEDFDAQGPTLKARRFVLEDVVYSLSSVLPPRLIRILKLPFWI